MSQLDEEDVAIDALFGLAGSRGWLTDGALRSAGGPINTRVSAVLSTEAAEWLRRDPVPGHERVADVSRNVKLAGNVVEVGDSQ